MIESLGMDCIRTARAKGLKEKVVIYSHAWRNALLPIITTIIGWFLGIFSGSVIIENMYCGIDTQRYGDTQCQNGTENIKHHRIGHRAGDDGGHIVLIEERIAEIALQQTAYR